MCALSTKPGFSVIGPQKVSPIDFLQIIADNGAIPAAQSLRRADHVRHDAERLGREELAGAARPSDRFSSKISRILCRSHTSRRIGRYSGGRDR